MAWIAQVPPSPRHPSLGSRWTRPRRRAVRRLPDQGLVADLEQPAARLGLRRRQAHRKWLLLTFGNVPSPLMRKSRAGRVAVAKTCPLPDGRSGSPDASNSTFALLVAVGEVTGRVVWGRLAGGLAAREHRRPLPCQGAAADARMEPTALAHRPAGGVSPLLHGPDLQDVCLAGGRVRCPAGDA